MFLAQCLCTITEDNPTAATSLANSNESLKILEKNLMCSDATEELLLLKVHMAGKQRKKGPFSLTIPQHFCSCCDLKPGLHHQSFCYHSRNVAQVKSKF